MTQEIIDDVIEISGKFQETDKAKKELIKIKIEADNFTYQLEKYLKQITIDESVEEEVKNITEDAEKLNSLLKEEDFENILNSYKKLQSDFNKLEDILSKKEKKKEKI